MGTCACLGLVAALLVRHASGQGQVRHAVYFERQPSQGDLAPANVLAELEARGFEVERKTSWSDVVAADAQEPVDVLIFDDGSIEDVDPSWAREAFEDSVVMAGINIGGAEMASLLDDERVAENAGEADAFGAGEHFSVAFTGLRGSPVALTEAAVHPEQIVGGGLDIEEPDHLDHWFSSIESATRADEPNVRPEDVLTYVFFGEIDIGVGYREQGL